MKYIRYTMPPAHSNRKLFICSETGIHSVPIEWKKKATAYKIHIGSTALLILIQISLGWNRFELKFNHLFRKAITIVGNSTTATNGIHRTRTHYLRHWYGNIFRIHDAKFGRCFASWVRFQHVHRERALIRSSGKAVTCNLFAISWVLNRLNSSCLLRLTRSLSSRSWMQVNI